MFRKLKLAKSKRSAIRKKVLLVKVRDTYEYLLSKSRVLRYFSARYSM